MTDLPRMCPWAYSYEPVLRALDARSGRIARSEIFLKDTAALLATLG
jgi:hypothetical protein